jgi:hypothetical protein
MSSVQPRGPNRCTADLMAAAIMPAVGVSEGLQRVREQRRAPRVAGACRVSSGGRPGSPGPGHAPSPVLLGPQVSGVGLEEQLFEHRVHRGLLTVPGLRDDQLPSACPARGVAVSHQADAAGVTSRTPHDPESGPVLPPA